MRVKRMRGQTSDSRFQLGSGSGWISWVIVGLLVLILAGLIWREWQRSQIVGRASHRFNIVMIAPNQSVTFVSFDPTEKTLFAIPFPNNLVIKSRTNGEYSITSLYKLGSYAGSGGMFARQKVQGFMRVPIPGYIVVARDRNQIKSTLLVGLLKVIFGRVDASLSRLDAMYLLVNMERYNYRETGEAELTRAAVFEKQGGQTIYHSERLQEYVGSRFFDWGVGETGVTVAVVNESGINGLGNDMADFLSNLGLDVIMVRSITNAQTLSKSEWQMANEESLKPLPDLFKSLFGFPSPQLGTDPEYRAQVVVKVGEDARDLF